MTVRDILAEYNEPKKIAREEDVYLQISRVRADKGFVGADVLAGWYQRNFRIFTNLAGIIEPTDRVLVIFGGAHLPTLRQLVKSSQDMQLVEANDYLLKH